VHPKGKELLDPGIDLRIHQFYGERVVGVVRPGIPPHCHLSPPERLDVVANEGTEDVHAQQSIPEQAFEDATCGCPSSRLHTPSWAQRPGTYP
jgi:hypothetical protein